MSHHRKSDAIDAEERTPLTTDGLNNNHMDGIDMKEIEGLLEQAGVGTTNNEAKWKTYLKLVTPHIVLVLVCCVYAFIGAIVFYNVEGPFEVSERSKSVANLAQLRQDIINSLWNNRKLSKDRWKQVGSLHIGNFTDSLFEAYSNAFVTTEDVLMDSSVANQERCWSMSTALFFSATTMSTIGFGNVVPTTLKGRIICVFFALFGTPLAIITIGDVGKFLSECTISLYRVVKLVSSSCSKMFRTCLRSARRASRQNVDEEEEQTSEAESEAEDEENDWENVEIDKEAVPVTLVLSLLLIYISTGALAFSILENWTYMDAFYFCFITLTTVGFGDLVPERTQYLAFWILYIGIGLAVTTMCIDLVGIQYIQKIHYFGRKFRGTDLLSLLQRRKQLQRQLLLASKSENPEKAFLQLWLDQQDDVSMASEMEPIQTVPLLETIVRVPLVTRWPSMIFDQWRSKEFAQPFTIEHSLPVQLATPQLSMPILLPSSYFCPVVFSSLRTDGSFVERFRFHGTVQRVYATPVLETAVSLSPMMTEEDVSPIIQCISDQVKVSPINSRCPIYQPDLTEDLMEPCPEFAVEIVTPITPVVAEEDYYPDETLSQGSDITDDFSPFGSVVDVELEFETQPLRDQMSVDAWKKWDTAYSLKSDRNLDEIEPLTHKENPVFSIEKVAVSNEAVLRNIMDCPKKFIATEIPDFVPENFCFVVNGGEDALSELQGDTKCWRPTGRPIRYYYSDDLKNFSRVDLIFAKGKVTSARLHGRARRLNVVADGSLASSSGMHEPVRAKLTLDKIFKVSRYYSYWKTCTGFHRIISVVEPVKERVDGSLQFDKRIFVQYLWRRVKETDKLRVTLEFETASLQVPQSLAAPISPNAASRQSSKSSTSPGSSRRQSHI